MRGRFHAPPHTRTGKILDFAQRAPRARVDKVGDFGKRAEQATLPLASFAQRALKRQKSSLAGFFTTEGRFFHKLRSLRGPCLSILLLTATLGLTHCSSDDGGGGSESTDTTPTDTDTGPSCDTELLSATMTLGSCTEITDTYVGYGSVVGTCAITDGSLLNDTFSLAGADYTISAILYAENTNALAFNVGEDIPTDDLVIQLDSREFAFSDTRRSFSSYVWDDPGLSWTSGSTASVKLCLK